MEKCKKPGYRKEGWRREGLHLTRWKKKNLPMATAARGGGEKESFLKRMGSA